MAPWTIPQRLGGTLERPEYVPARRESVRHTGRFSWRHAAQIPDQPTRVENVLAGKYCDVQAHEYERAKDADLRAIRWANETTPEERLAIAVGLLDGEACFHNNGSITVGNTNYEMLCRLQLVFGGRISIHRRWRKSERHTFPWRWALSAPVGRLVQTDRTFKRFALAGENRTPKVPRRPRTGRALA